APRTGGRARQRGLAGLARLAAGLAAALVGVAVVLPPLVVLLYALSRRWDRSLWPEGATLAWFAELAADPRVGAATLRTLVVAFASASLATGLGAAATLAARLYAPRLLAALDLLAQLPYAIPPVVVAIAALEIFVGRWGGWIDTRLLYLLLLTPLSFPLVHRTLGAALQRIEVLPLLEAGRTLGAPDRHTLRRVLLPLLVPALAAAYLLALSAAALEFAIANLLLGGSNELLQPLMNSLRVSSGHRAAALIGLSLGIVGGLAALVQWLTAPRPR
ncbi:MAG: ABC transporter permease subunit, partial [Burkholderiales bacterium]|nr:ABC transporter permease subunit [Burkholderiales bacterium]